MSYEYSSWTEIKLTVKVTSLDSAVAIMSAVNPGLMIEDYSDFDLGSVYGDLVDEKILTPHRRLYRRSFCRRTEILPVRSSLSASGSPRHRSRE